MTSRAAKFLSISTPCILIIPVIAACGQLKPEAQKTRSPDSTYQELSVYANYDTSTNTWSYNAFMNLHADTKYGTRSALSAGESILINGETPINSGTATEPWYYISKTGTPPSTFTFVWTSADGRVFSNECALADFSASGSPSTSSRTGTFSIVFTTPETTGTARGDLSQLEAGTYRSGGALSVAITATNPTATLNFAAAQMTNLNAGSTNLNLSWTRSSTLTNATPVGGDCQITVNHKHIFAVTD